MFVFDGDVLVRLMRCDYGRVEGVLYVLIEVRKGKERDGRFAIQREILDNGYICCNNNLD